MLMKFGKGVTACVCLLLLATVVSAQIVEPHISFGMKPSRNIPPEVVDMSWARGEPFGPADGKVMYVFILAGLPALEGRGDSRELSVDIRRGSSRVLMFEDGLWQPLRPTGLRFGPEIGFGLRMSREFHDETVGIILPSSDGTEDIIGKARKALGAAPCQAIALVQLGRKALDYVAVADEVKARLGEPELVVLDISDGLSSPRESCSAEMEIAFGDRVAQRLLEILFLIAQEK